MPFFNFRRGSPTTAAGAAGPAESVEAMRKRAKHRLIGAVVLVLIGVVGFPLLFDTQPRPVAVDIPIEIPGKNTVKPLVMPAPAAAAPKVTASAPAPAADKVAAPASLTPSEEIVSDKPAAPAKPAQSAIKSEAKPEPKAVAKTPAATDEATRAKALLEGKPATAAAAPAAAKVVSTDAEGRLVVQVGAFADEAKAREVRQKLERAGLKTYTQVADTKDGKRTRVRVGPFATREDADKAASKIKGLDLPASILTL
ncbi:MAG: SPOR domain-containing protein [Pseudomonadota bacterium]|nr:SPOR domain-containing protein [Pseudomonadota bacterium]